MDKQVTSNLDDARSKIIKLENAIKASREIQIEIPIAHYFAPGIYMREMTMPKGSVVVGKIHKTEHLCVLSKGSVTVVSDDGRKFIAAPSVIHAKPGTKRAIHAHEETVWVNVHHNPTNEQDEHKIDDLFVVETFDQFLSFKEQKNLEGGI